MKDARKKNASSGELVCLGGGSECERRDSNPHVFRHGNLNPARLPISPLSRRIYGENEDGCRRNRTFNLRIKSPVLCQLSYAPKGDHYNNKQDQYLILKKRSCTRQDSNLRPTDSKSVALSS